MEPACIIPELCVYLLSPFRWPLLAFQPHAIFILFGGGTRGAGVCPLRLPSTQAVVFSGLTMSGFVDSLDCWVSPEHEGGDEEAEAG